MKRVISIVMSFAMIMSLCVCVNAASFSDLSTSHWAYKNIDTLVNEGTINGYEDGTFKPSKSVTSAEFGKMIGKWDQKYDGAYKDITDKHWAYEYIMWSGLDSMGSMIYPDAEIKRGEVINLIWKRNGSPKHSAAPSAISNQGTNPDAASWAYTIGLMKGDDGLNLRLESSLTRAEAATLIVRSREVVAANASNNFIDVVDEKLLETVYNSLNLLGEKYDKDKVLTNAEIARMAIVFGADGGAINFVGNDLIDKKGNVGKLFEHKYSNEMFILSTNVWGEESYTLKKAEEPATVQDAISAIMYGFLRRGTTPMDLGKKNDYYPDCKDANSTILENMYLTYAKTHGVKLYTDANIGAKDPITVKKFAALLLQVNEIAGLGVGYSNGEKGNAKMNAYLTEYPSNYEDFHLTIANAPLELYSLKKDGVSAKASYNAINQCAFVYNAYLNEVNNKAKKNTECSMSAVFYPALSYKQNNRVLFTAKFIVKDSQENVTFSIDKMFGDLIKTPTGLNVKPNSEFYVVFETYEPLMDIYLPLNAAYVKAVYTK